MNILLCCGGGAGDSVQALNYAHYLQINNNVDVLCFMRDETFRPLKYLFGKQFNLIQHKEREKFFENYWVINNQDVLKAEFPDYDKIEFHVPDLLMRKIDWTDIPVHPQVIKQTRLLTEKWSPENRIYVGMNTSTPDYHYNFTPELIKRLAIELPNYQIYFNNITEWAGKKINNGDFSNLPLNVEYVENQDFCESLEWLRKSCYCVCLDNGVSHFAYQLGIPRLLLSRRLEVNGVAWLARWYEDLNECVPYTYAPFQLAQCVKINVQIPQTTLINRQIVLNNPMTDWTKALIFKF